MWIPNRFLGVVFATWKGAAIIYKGEKNACLALSASKICHIEHHYVYGIVSMVDRLLKPAATLHSPFEWEIFAFCFTCQIDFYMWSKSKKKKKEIIASNKVMDRPIDLGAHVHNAYTYIHGITELNCKWTKNKRKMHK